MDNVTDEEYDAQCSRNEEAFRQMKKVLNLSSDELTDMLSDVCFGVTQAAWLSIS